MSLKVVGYKIKAGFLRGKGTYLNSQREANFDALHPLGAQHVVGEELHLANCTGANLGTQVEQYSKSCEVSQSINKMSKS